MSKLGVSIYPEHSDIIRDKQYLKLAAGFGFSRIFTCLLSVEDNLEEMMEKFTEVNGYAKDLGFEVIFDVAPSVFERLGLSDKYFGITPGGLKVFKDMNADGIRLDGGFGAFVDSELTHNQEGLNVEFNASLPGKYIEELLVSKANKEQLIACHNFYPQQFTGLGHDYFMKTSKEVKRQGINLAAFISSNQPNTFGPWPVNDGLVTMEMHRGLPIDLQTRHMFATKLVDDVIIGNAYASEEELRAISEVDPTKLSMKIDVLDNLQEVEKEILFNHPHYVRGDLSDYLVRSTIPRLIYKNVSISPREVVKELKRGDVVIVNDGYGRYKGELHICLQDMKNDGKKNLVGRVKKEEQILLPYLTSLERFRFIK